MQQLNNVNDIIFNYRLVNICDKMVTSKSVLIDEKMYLTQNYKYVRPWAAIFIKKKKNAVLLNQ